MVVEKDNQGFVTVDGNRISSRPLPATLDSRNVIEAGRFDFIEIVDHAGKLVDLLYLRLTPVNMPRLYMHKSGSFFQ